MNLHDLLMYQAVSEGGSSVEVEPLEVTENGEYSEEGKAYSPVTVNVGGIFLQRYKLKENLVENTGSSNLIYNVYGYLLDFFGVGQNASVTKITFNRTTSKRGATCSYIAQDNGSEKSALLLATADGRPDATTSQYRFMLYFPPESTEALRAFVLADD